MTSNVATAASYSKWGPAFPIVTAATRAVAAATASLDEAESSLDEARKNATALADQLHTAELRHTELAGRREAIRQRLETEWRRSLEDLLAGFDELDTETDDLRLEAAQLRASALLQRTIAEYAATDARVAYVMHADFKRMFLEVFHREPLGCPYNASISRLTITPQGTRLDDYNNVGHMSSDLWTL